MAILVERKAAFLSGMLLAVIWLSYCFYSLFYQADKVEPKHLAFRGEIVSLVNQDRDWISFDVKRLDDSVKLFPSYYRLTWSRPAPELEDTIKLGQEWHFIANMKGISSVLNQGGYNQQKQWLSRHIVAKGRVKQARLLAQEQSVRHLVHSRLTSVFAKLEGGDILQALLLGNQQAIASQRWEALRRTGAGHLVAISGLHVSVVFALMYFLSRLAINYMAPCESRRNLFIAMGLALLTVIGYGYLAGFAIATQRAIIMLSLLLGLSVCARYASPWERLVFGLFIVLLIDPLAPLSSGFWLSFSALAIILFTLSTRTMPHSSSESSLLLGQETVIQEAVAQETVVKETVVQEIVPTFEPMPTAATKPNDTQRAVATGLTAYLIERAESVLALCRRFNMKLWSEPLFSWFIALWAIQWRLAVGLGLLQALLFGSLPLHSVWLNLLFVPWFSFVVIPLAIVSLIVWLCCFGVAHWFMNAEFSANFFTLSEWSLRPFLWLLDMSQYLPMAQLNFSSEVLGQAMLALLGFSLCVYIRRRGWILACLSLCLPLTLGIALPLLPTGLSLPAKWQVHVLDVGQGSAIVIQRGNRGIVYDTGAAYGSQFSYADRVILPFLAVRGITALDYLILSHDDNDHRGGDGVMIKAFPKVQIISDIQDERLKPALSCQPARLHWQGLTLDIMGIGTKEARAGKISDNNASCVVRVGSPTHKVLLTGDIEKPREYRLIHRGEPIKAQVLLAPHHGSKTSSSMAFLTEVEPELVIFSAGFENQYGFPKDEVVNRYQKLGITRLTTGELGQISLTFSQSGYEVQGYRSELAPFWYNALFRFGQSKKPE